MATIIVILRLCKKTLIVNINQMRNIFILNLLFISMLSFSQMNYDTRLNTRYSDEYLQTLSENKLRDLEFKLDNVYYIIDDFEKNSGLQELYKINNSTKKVVKQTLTNVDFDNFNILDYHYVQNYNTDNYYKIGDTGKTLVIISVKEYTNKFNNYRNY